MDEDLVARKLPLQLGQRVAKLVNQRGRPGSQDERPDVAPGLKRKVLANRVQHVHQRTEVLMHPRRGGRRDKLVADSGKRVSAEFFAESLDLQTDRRRREVHAFCSFGHAPRGHHDPERLQLAQFHGSTFYDTSPAVSMNRRTRAIVAKARKLH